MALIPNMPRWSRNFYVVVLICFGVWMLFFDRNDVWSMLDLHSQVDKLEEEKVFYNKKIEEVTKERDALLNDNDKLEQFAREKYFLKKPEEDLYIYKSEK